MFLRFDSPAKSNRWTRLRNWSVMPPSYSRLPFLDFSAKSLKHFQRVVRPNSPKSQRTAAHAAKNPNRLLHYRALLWAQQQRQPKGITTKVIDPDETLTTFSSVLVIAKIIKFLFEAFQAASVLIQAINLILFCSICAWQRLFTENWPGIIRRTATNPTKTVRATN